MHTEDFRQNRKRLRKSQNLMTRTPVHDEISVAGCYTARLLTMDGSWLMYVDGDKYEVMCGTFSLIFLRYDAARIADLFEHLDFAKKELSVCKWTSKAVVFSSAESCRARAGKLLASVFDV